MSRNNNDSLILAIKLLGFEDVNQYLSHLSQLMSAKKRLAKSGVFLERLPQPVLTEAIRLASGKLGLKYPVIFVHKPVAANKAAKTLGGGSICWQCHYNNCDECGSQMENETPAGDGTNEDGPGYNCRQNARARRQNAIDQAYSAAIVALVSCGGSGWAAGELACGTSVATIIGAPVAPEVGAFVGCAVFIGCSGFVLNDYELKLQQAELEYQANIAGCP